MLIFFQFKGLYIER